MNIIVVGLGLIGGSFSKAIKRYTKHTCWGMDNDTTTIQQALHEGAIDGAITTEQLSKGDLIIICLHPQATLDFIHDHAAQFSDGSIVIDVCGVKQAIVEQAVPLLAQHGVTFIGTHPMAGREHSGFAYALADLYVGASFILTPVEPTDHQQINVVKELAQAIGFTKIVESTPLLHDQTIAFTSQLAHIVSNGYIKSPTLENESGYSAGSFLDLTRVAKLNEQMWTELFMMNKEPLLFEIEQIMVHLEQYKQALLKEDANAMKQLLKQGRELKEKSLTK